MYKQFLALVCLLVCVFASSRPWSLINSDSGTFYATWEALPNSIYQISFEKDSTTDAGIIVIDALKTARDSPNTPAGVQSLYDRHNGIMLMYVTERSQNSIARYTLQQHTAPHTLAEKRTVLQDIDSPESLAFDETGTRVCVSASGEVRCYRTLRWMDTEGNLNEMWYAIAHYSYQDGQQQPWPANSPDMLNTVALDGSSLWIDDSRAADKRVCLRYDIDSDLGTPAYTMQYYTGASVSQSTAQYIVWESAGLVSLFSEDYDYTGESSLYELKWTGSSIESALYSPGAAQLADRDVDQATVWLACASMQQGDMQTLVLTGHLEVQYDFSGVPSPQPSQSSSPLPSQSPSSQSSQSPSPQSSQSPSPQPSQSTQPSNPQASASQSPLAKASESAAPVLPSQSATPPPIQITPNNTLYNDDPPIDASSGNSKQRGIFATFSIFSLVPIICICFVLALLFVVVVAMIGQARRRKTTEKIIVQSRQDTSLNNSTVDTRRLVNLDDATYQPDHDQDSDSFGP